MKYTEIKITLNRKNIILLALIIFSLSSMITYKLINRNRNVGKFISSEIQMKNIRESVVAGRFYPGTKEELTKTIQEFFEKVERKNIPTIKGLVSPHAGYIYSGQVAAYGYAQIDDNTKTVILLGPSHHVYFVGASVPNFTHYRTPLGEIKLSSKVKDLLKEDIIVSYDEAHSREHSLEVQLPFLQERLKDFEIIPIVTGEVDPKRLADVLMDYIDDNTLIVASSDLSHYYPYDKAIALDNFCTEAIPNLDFSEMNACEACGKIPILTLMHIAEKLGWKGEVLDYKNSGDTAGNKDKVVGYASIVFFKEMLNEEEQEYLLKLARRTLEFYLKDGSKPNVDETSVSQRLKKVQGCFVTLKKHGDLRGCIGHILPQEELYKCVIDNAINAAVNDRRFNPITYDELKDIQIEISVLSVPKELEYDSPEELLSILKPMKDGVVIKSGWHRSTYLPQVWEQLPDKEVFLSRLCMKAGLISECWKSKDVKVETYQAFVFGEDNMYR